MTTVERRPTNPGWRIAMDQLVHATVALWRTQVVLIFTFAMPVAWLVLIGLLAGNDAVGDDGVRVMQFAAPTAIALGTFFATMPPVAISVAEAREKGLLKRMRSTPLPAWCYFFGQVGAACVFAAASLVVTLLLSITLYGVRLQAQTLPATSATLLVGIVAFSAVGLAIGALSRSAAIAEAVSIGAAVVLAFISGLFLVGGQLPTWLDRVASAFPLKPYAVSLQDQFNPFADGWEPVGLAVISAWGLLGVVVSLRAFRWDPHRPRGVPGPVPAAHAEEKLARTSPAGSTTTATTNRPSPLRFVWLQASAALRIAVRRPGDVFFTLAMPIGLFALLVTVQGNGTFPNGHPVALSTAASMVTWGAGVAAFMNLAESVARARDLKVLKRMRSTPMPARDYLAGRAIAVLVLVLVLAAVILVPGAAVYQLRIGLAGLTTGVLILVVGTVSLAACGFLLAALMPSARAVGAVGLILLFVLSFFSDVFINAGPDWMSTIGSLFPLKHLQNGLATTWHSDGTQFPWLNLVVLVGWGVTAGLLAIWRFRWEPGTR